jgi:Ca2+-transporting ATPase
LHNTSSQGFHAAEAEGQQKQYGKNERSEKKRISVFVLVLKQFKDGMICILLPASLIPFSTGHLKDAYIPPYLYSQSILLN